MLESRWWIGEKARTKTETRVWNEETQRYKRSGKKPHKKPIIVKTNLADNPDKRLVSVETWEKVQTILQHNSQTWTAQTTRLNEFLGAGLLTCQCGAKMYHHKDPRTGKKSSYICSLKHRGKGHPEAQYFWSDDVDNEIGLQAVMTMGKKDFIQARIKEAMSADKTAEKKITVSRIEKDITSLERRKKNLVDAIEQIGLSPDVHGRIKDLDSSIADAKFKLMAAKDELKANLQDSDVDKLAARMSKDFSNFMKMDLPDRKALLATWIERIDLRRDEESGMVVVAFAVKVGVPEPTHQRDSFPVVPTPKAKSFRKDPLRVEKGEPVGGVGSIEDTARRLGTNSATIARSR